jgi:threonine/homoserine/homoserine lactone efflux protein
MEMSVFLKGIMFGALITIPIGPIGILCIQRTLQFGRVSGLLSGLGAAVADAIYAGFAVFGLTFISNFLVVGQFWLRLIGGAVLLYIGWKIFFAKVNESKKISHTTLLNDFSSTFFLTMTNPTTIFAFLVAFASFGLTDVQGSYLFSSMLVFGVFLGSVIGWVLLSEGVTLFRERINNTMMRAINRVAGVIIAGFGIAAFVMLIVSKH